MSYSVQAIDLLDLTMQNSFNHFFYFQQSLITPSLCWCISLSSSILNTELNALFHTIPVAYKRSVQSNALVCLDITSLLLWMHHSASSLSSCHQPVDTDLFISLHVSGWWAPQLRGGGSHNSLCQTSFCCNIISTSSSCLCPWCFPN